MSDDRARLTIFLWEVLECASRDQGTLHQSDNRIYSQDKNADDDELWWKTNKNNSKQQLLTHTHTFNGPLSGTTWVSRYQKGKTNLDFTQARDSEWQWHQLGHMQVCTSLQTDNHASTPPLSFLQAGCPSCRPTNSVNALKANNNCSMTLYSRQTRWVSACQQKQPPKPWRNQQTQVYLNWPLKWRQWSWSVMRMDSHAIQQLREA